MKAGRQLSKGRKRKDLWSKEMAPRVTSDAVLRLDIAKEITYMYTQLHGTPGLTFRKGKTKHSYQWSPIIPDGPVATRTRTRFKS